MPRANSKKNGKRKRSPLPINGIASRTRRQKNIVASWNIPVPITIEIISWFEQESLINFSVVSKQMHGIIHNEPGNKNKIISVFEVRGSSTLELFQNIRGYFLNEKTKKRLQSYNVMTFKGLHHFHHKDFSKLIRMVGKEDFRMNGITSLNFSTPSPKIWGLPSIIMKILPKLREVDLSGTTVTNGIINELSYYCPLLEKVVTSRSSLSDGINLTGLAMSDSRYLKEIHMNNVVFCIHLRDGNKMSDLNNHREMFIFHHCCKALERVSILNMKLEHSSVHGWKLKRDQMHLFQPDHDESSFIQNALIKFVRSVPSLRWFRSDLTSENMTMLRRERPEIELLN